MDLTVLPANYTISYTTSLAISAMIEVMMEDNVAMTTVTQSTNAKYAILNCCHTKIMPL